MEYTRGERRKLSRNGFGRRNAAPDAPISKREIGASGEWRDLGESLFDGCNDTRIAGRHVRGEAGEDSTIAADEEFFEVPKDAGWSIGSGEILRLQVAGDAVAEAGVVDEGVGCGGGEFAIEGVDFGALDGDFGEDWEGDGVVDGAELGDFLVCAGLLSGEVVGGEAEDDEAAVFELLIELLKGGVLRGEAALGGDVHDEEDFAGVVGEGGRRAIEGGQGDTGERGHGISLATFI